MTRRTAGCVSMSGAAAGVVTTSTGPWRAASTSSSGVVSTTSPRKAVWMTRLVNLQDRQERLLWDLDRSHLLHALLSFFLLLEQLALARHVAPIALGGDVLAQRADRLAGDHFGPDRGLDHDLEQLARDQLFQLLGDLLAPLVRFVTMDDDRERVHRVAVEQYVELDEVSRAVLEELVVERRIATGDRLQLVVEVEDDLGEREFQAELDARRVHVMHALVHAAPLLAQLHDAADVLGRRHDPRLDVRFLDVVDGRAVRHEARVLAQPHGGVRLVHGVLHFHKTDGTMQLVENPSLMPHGSAVDHIEEPYVKARIVAPAEYIGGIMKLGQERRGVYKGMHYVDPTRVEFTWEFPLAEIILDFYDKLKTISRGYASLDYEFLEYRPAELVKLDMLLNSEAVDAFSVIIHRDKAYEWGRKIAEKLKELIPRQLFEVVIQAAIGTKVVARETVRPLRKNVTAKCYGGDVTRKRKLLEKQKEGKKRMKQVGTVEIPQEAFLAVLQVD